MAKTFFFYDLETSGLNPRKDRIMQFAGVRTDENFQQIGKSYNVLVALNDDTLPSPGALMVTGITPQQTVQDGYTEAQFAKIFTEEICTPDTTILGFNNIRFDDEFIRALLWRNFYDPYEWAYKDGRSRWDMLDVVRLTRVLRPEGVEWPEVDGLPVNKLELISKVNGLEHTKAHDALSDVEALIAVTKLIAKQQPQLFNYLLNMRHKKAVGELVNTVNPKPFVYASGRYDSRFNKTTVALPIAEAEHGSLCVYDLRYDPAEWIDKTESELNKILNTPWDERDERYKPLPIKKLQPNRAPAVAPLGVLEQANGWQKISLTLNEVEANYKKILAADDFVRRAVKLLDRRPNLPPLPDAEGKIYDGFLRDHDKLRCETVRNASFDDMRTLAMPKFDDERLVEIFPRYKVRNYPQFSSREERASYEAYRTTRLASQLPSFLDEMQKLATRDDLSSHQQYVLEELQLWMESILPEDEQNGLITLN